MLFNGKLPIIKGLLVIVDKLYMDDYRGLFPDAVSRPCLLSVI